MTKVIPKPITLMQAIVGKMRTIAAITDFTNHIEIVPRSISERAFQFGHNRMILLRDGGLKKGARSTESCIWDLTIHIAVIDTRGDVTRTLSVDRVMNVTQDIAEQFDENTSLQLSDETSTMWIEESHVIDCPQVEEIWQDITDENAETPWVMSPIDIVYKIYCRET